jgi:outer membrane protein OmpA-like peptidoglycan-associated protein
LDELADFLKKNANVLVEIGGHTNGFPPHEYCDKLSYERAKNVVNYLILKGVKPNQLSAKGYGKRAPIADNSTEYGRKMNQRVEVKVLRMN